MAGCMMCTTRSPRSTSTHSPVSSPSTDMIGNPFSFAFSRTCEASARVWRLEVAVATTTRSKRSDSSVVLNTLMSCALMSSSASTTVRCSLVMVIDDVLVGWGPVGAGRCRAPRKGGRGGSSAVQTAAFDVFRHAGRQQLPRHLALRQLAPQDGGGDRDRRHAEQHDIAA